MLSGGLLVLRMGTLSGFLADLVWCLISQKGLTEVVLNFDLAVQIHCWATARSETFSVLSPLIST